MRLLRKSIHTARIAHDCCYCINRIEKGDMYVVLVYLNDKIQSGRIVVVKMHHSPECNTDPPDMEDKDDEEEWDEDAWDADGEDEEELPVAA